MKGKVGGEEEFKINDYLWKKLQEYKSQITEFRNC